MMTACVKGQATESIRPRSTSKEPSGRSTWSLHAIGFPDSRWLKMSRDQIFFHLFQLILKKLDEIKSA